MRRVPCVITTLLNNLHRIDSSKFSAEFETANFVPGFRLWSKLDHPVCWNGLNVGLFRTLEFTELFATPSAFRSANTSFQCNTTDKVTWFPTTVARLP